MKKLISFLIIILFCTNAYAITGDQLIETKKTLYQIMQKINQIIFYVDLVMEGKIREIDLTAEQKQKLLNLYETKKSEIQELYQQLP